MKANFKIRLTMHSNKLKKKKQKTKKQTGLQMKRNHCFGYYFQFNKKKMCIVVKCQNIFKNIFGKGE